MDKDQATWFSEGGLNSPFLSPRSSGVVKTLPPSKVSVFDGALPPESEEISAVNSVYMEVIGAISVNKWGMVLGALLAVPGAIAGVPAFLMVALGSQKKILGLIIVMAMALIAGISMAASFFCLAFFSPADEPFRFDRVNRTLTWCRARKWRLFGIEAPIPGSRAEIVVYQWENIRAEVVRKLIFTGKTARMDCFLELAMIDPKTQLVSERFRVGDRDVFSDFKGRILLWESIRRYMEEGPERVSMPRPKVSDKGFIDSIESFNPVSAPFLFPAGTPRFFGALIGLLMWVFTPMNILFALCNWIGAKTAKAVDWGPLEHTVFKVDAHDALTKAQREKEQQLHASTAWSSEQKRRRLAALAWLVLILVWWFAFAWWLNLSPFADSTQWRQAHDSVIRIQQVVSV
ncbi:MAG: hypothetical protein EOP38_11065 [Rubrivivax sp.]|nr:MAG: hypothetical protein EOP38_11065 [Rubrivivax sp.]